MRMGRTWIAVAVVVGLAEATRSAAGASQRLRVDQDIVGEGGARTQPTTRSAIPAIMLATTTVPPSTCKSTPTREVISTTSMPSARALIGDELIGKVWIKANRSGIQLQRGWSFPTSVTPTISKIG